MPGFYYYSLIIYILGNIFIRYLQLTTCTFFACVMSAMMHWLSVGLTSSHHTYMDGFTPLIIQKIPPNPRGLNHNLHGIPSYFFYYPGIGLKSTWSGLYHFLISVACSNQNAIFGMLGTPGHEINVDRTGWSVEGWPNWVQIGKTL